MAANVTLKEGTNTITIKATTSDGSDSKTVRVKYNEPKVMPAVKITSPKNNYSTENERVAVKANLQNVLTKNDVTLLVNGKKVTAFIISEERSIRILISKKVTIQYVLKEETMMEMPQIRSL